MWGVNGDTIYIIENGHFDCNHTDNAATVGVLFGYGDRVFE